MAHYIKFDQMIVEEVLTGVSYHFPEGLEYLPRSYEDLRTQLATASCVPVNQQILMTPQGQLAGPNQMKSPLLLFSRDMVRIQGLPHLVHPIRSIDDFVAPIPAEERDVVILERKLHEMASNYNSLLAWVENGELQVEAAKAHIRLMAVAHKALVEYSGTYEAYQLGLFQKLQDKFNVHCHESMREIESFDQSIEHLEHFELAPSLRSPQRRTLSDLLDIPSLKQWKDGYITELARLQVKFDEVEGEVKRVCKKAFDTPPAEEGLAVISFEELRGACSQGLAFYKEYRALCDLFIFKNDSKAKAKLHEVNWQERINRLQAETGFVEGLKAKTAKLIQGLLDLRNTSGSQLLTTLKQVTEANLKVKDVVSSQVAMLNSLVNRSTKHLKYLIVPRHLPNAYQATLKEVARRRYFRKKADGMLTKLKLLIEDETKLRCEFLTCYRNVIPKHFIPQLSEGPLLDFKEHDPDRYLPEVEGSLESTELQSLYLSFTELQSIYEDSEAEDSKSEQAAEVKLLLADRDRLKHEVEMLVLSQGEILEQLKQVQEKCEKSQRELSQAEALLSKAQADIKDLEAKQVEVYDWGYQMSKDLRITNEQLAEANDKLKDYDRLLKQSRQDQGFATLASSLELSAEATPEKVVSVFRSLKHDLAKAKFALRSSICFTSFEVGSLALFFPSAHGSFVAFNCNTPYHFLDFDSLKSTTQALMSTKHFIVGEIMRRRTFTAAAEYNPFSLVPGTGFTVLSINEVDF